MQLIHYKSQGYTKMAQPIRASNAPLDILFYICAKVFPILTELFVFSMPLLSVVSWYLNGCTVTSLIKTMYRCLLVLVNFDVCCGYLSPKTQCVILTRKCPFVPAKWFAQTKWFYIKFPYTEIQSSCIPLQILCVDKYTHTYTCANTLRTLKCSLL